MKVVSKFSLLFLQLIQKFLDFENECGGFFCCSNVYIIDAMSLHLLLQLKEVIYLLVKSMFT
jgi:hypothetical protein